MADKRENIDIIVELHDRLSRPADKAGEKVSDLRDDVEELNTELEEHDQQTRKSDKATVSWTKSTGKATKSANAHTKAIERAKKALAAQNKEASRGARALDVLEKSTSRVDRTMMRAARGGGRALKMALVGLLVVGVVPFLYAAVGAITALGAAAYAAVAGLAPLVGTLGAMPALITALIQPIAAVKMGFKGFGESLKVLNDPESTLEEIRETLDAMTPAGRRLANTLMELKEQTAGWGKAIQGSMFPGFNRGLKELGPILPIVRRGLVGSGAAVGELVENVGKFVGDSGPALETVMARNTRMLERGFGPALLSVLSIFRDLAVAGGPMAERFSLWVADSTDNLAKLVRQGRNSGRLEAFFERAGDRAAAVKDTLADLAVALFNIGKYSSVLGDAMGSDISRGFAELRAWTESSRGEKSITGFFASALPVVRELAKWVGALGVAMGRSLGNPQLMVLLTQMRTELGPALSAMFGSLATDVGPAVIDFFTGLAYAIAALPTTPLLELIKAIGFLTKGLGDIMTASPALGSLAAALLTIIAVQKTGTMITGRWNKAVGSSTGLIGRSMASLRGMAAAFDTTNRASQRATMSVGAFAAAERKRTAAVRAGIGTMAKGAAAAGGLALVASGAADGMGLGNTAALAMAGSLMGPWGAAAGGAVGLLLDMKGAATEASSAYTDLKDNMVTEVGRSDDLRAQIAAAREEIDKLDNWEGAGGWWAKVSTEFMNGRADATEQYQVQIDKATAELDRLTAYENAAATDRRYLASVQRETDALNAKIGAMREESNQYRSQFDAETRLREARVAANNQAAANNAGIDGNTAAALANRNAISTLSSAWNSQSRKVKNNVGRYKEMRAEFVKTIENMGVGKKRAQELADELLDIPKKVETRMVVRDEAKQKVLDLKAALDSIKDKTVTMRVVGDTAIQTPGFGPQSFTGNPTHPGFRSWVGEMGPELFVPRDGGRPSLIGARGPEQMTFAKSGYIVPNPSTPDSVAKPLPQWVVDRLDGESSASGPSQGPSGGSGADSGSAGGSDGPAHLHVHVGDGGGTTLTKEDVRVAALQAYRQWERERKERK